MSEVNEKIDGLVKTVKDATDAMMTAHGSHKEEVKVMVEQAIKTALDNDPRITAPRKVQFATDQAMSGKDLAAALPEEAKKELDDVFLMSKVLRKDVRTLKSWSKWGQKFTEFKKALDAATSGGGSDWVPTGFTSRLWELVRIEGAVAPLFETISMPTNPYVLPVQVGRIASKKHAEQTGDSPTKIPVGDGSSITGSKTLTAVGHGVRVLVSKDLEEDSIIPMLPFLQRQIVLAIAQGRENFIINGDTAGTQDSDDSASDANTRICNGLRYHALHNSYSADLATFTLSQIRTNLRAAMGRFGINPADLAYICDMRTYLKMVDIEAVTTLEKFGPNATNLKGSLGFVDGSPVIVSEWARNSLNASGAYDGVTTNKGVLLLVNRNGFVIGERRQASVNVYRELYAESDQDAVVTRERVVFADTYPIASNTSVYAGYNVG